MTTDLVVSTPDVDAIITQDPSNPGRYTIMKTSTITTTVVTTVTIDVEAVEPPAPKLDPYIGMTALPGTEWDSVLAYYGANKIAAVRLFGKDNQYQLNGAYDTDTLTEWQKWNTEKWAGVNKKALAVLSVKDDADEFLDAWAATFPPTADLAALGFPGTVASYWHEPEDNVRAGEINWAGFRQQGIDIASWRERHPRGKELIKWVGPILTRYDLVDLNNDPTNAGFEGMNIFMFDTYQSSPTEGTYWTPQKMLDEPASRIQAKFPGITMGVPEYGFARQNVDSTGSGWAKAHEDFVNFVRADGRYLFAIAYNSAGSMPEVPFYTSAPVAPLYRDTLLHAFA